MKSIKKILLFVFAFVLAIALVGCQTGGTIGGVTIGGGTTGGEQPGGGTSSGTIDNTQVIQDSQMKTPFTDELKLTQAYLGKSFIEDGIGEVKLSSSTDGDTAVFKEGATQITVRFNGVNTPESTYKLEPWGKAAARFTKSKLQNAYKIVLQADTLKTNRLDSTGKRYLAWVWYQATETSEFRLLNLELIEQSYSSSKASGMLYADQMQDADLETQKLGVRIYNNTVKDPDYDYSETGKYLTIKEIRDNAEEYSSSNIKVIVRGIVARKNGSYSAYIQQQEDGVWHIGDKSLEVKASDENPDMPMVGENGNWWIGELDTEVEAVNGLAGQSLYDYYKASLEDAQTALDEASWYDTLVKEEIDVEMAYPYIVRDGEWYGIYLYGGFSGQSSKLNEGNEIRVGGNFSLYAGSLQITNVTPQSIQVISKGNEQHIYKVEDITELNLQNQQLFNCLVEIYDLTVYGGYNTKTSDGFTIKCKDSKGNLINIRVDGNTSLHQTEDGVYVVVASSTNTTGRKGYWSEGVLDDNGYGLVNCWEFFQGKTIKVLRGIVGIYDPSQDGEASQAQVQIMLSREDDVVFAE